MDKWDWIDRLWGLFFIGFGAHMMRVVYTEWIADGGPTDLLLLLRLSMIVVFISLGMKLTFSRKKSGA